MMPPGIFPGGIAGFMHLDGVSIPMNDTLLRAIVDDLPIEGTARSVEFLDKGFSDDRKYLITCDDKAAYLLRVSDIAKKHIRQADFDYVSKLSAKSIACPRAMHFGENAGNGVCYGLYTYILGDCAEDALPKLTTAQQYSFGLQAGKELLKIHFALAPTEVVDDFARRGGSHTRHSKMVAEQGITFSGQKTADAYVEKNLHLLHNRPTTFRHGDYHPGNLIVKDGKLAGVIDFNRCDWGDPIDDFYKIALFGAPLSQAYACGELTGYFGGGPPEDFWPLYNLYVAAILPSDIVWTQQHYPQHLAASIELIELITATHDFVDGGPPDWWQNGNI